MFFNMGKIGHGSEKVYLEDRFTVISKISNLLTLRAHTKIMVEYSQFHDI